MFSMTRQGLFSTSRQGMFSTTRNVLNDKTRNVLNDNTRNVLNDKECSQRQDKNVLNDKTRNVLNHKECSQRQGMFSTTRNVLNDKTRNVLNDKTSTVLRSTTRQGMFSTARNVLNHPLLTFQEGAAKVSCDNPLCPVGHSSELSKRDGWIESQWCEYFGTEWWIELTQLCFTWISRIKKHELCKCCHNSSQRVLMSSLKQDSHNDRCLMFYAQPTAKGHIRGAYDKRAKRYC